MLPTVRYRSTWWKRLNIVRVDSLNQYLVGEHPRILHSFYLRWWSTDLQFLQFVFTDGIAQCVQIQWSKWRHSPCMSGHLIHNLQTVQVRSCHCKKVRTWQNWFSTFDKHNKSSWNGNLSYHVSYSFHALSHVNASKRKLCLDPPRVRKTSCNTTWRSLELFLTTRA